MKSKIFTNTEQDVLNKRLEGIKAGSSTGMYSGRVKPKVKELLEIWIPKKKELQKLVKIKISEVEK